MKLVQRIHDAPGRGVVAVTGGGSMALSALLTVPGASNTLLEALVPYSPAALTAFLGRAPAQACAEPTARAMAMAAYQRARALGRDEAPLFGLGLTASLATHRDKRGGHRIHVATQSFAATHSRSVVLSKGRRSRQAEEKLARDLALAALAASLGIAADGPVLDPDDEPYERHAEAPADVAALLAGRTTVVGRGDAAAAVVLPGAFNPLHDGHREMARIAAERSGRPVAFEICVNNVDKLPLDFVDIDTRLAQFPDDTPVWLTRCPTFVEKARQFPGATFVVGADTIVRIADARYYGGRAAREAAFAELAAHGVHFLVFGRAAGGRFLTIDDLELPVELATLCESVGEHEFRNDITSSELR